MRSTNCFETFFRTVSRDFCLAKSPQRLSRQTTHNDGVASVVKVLRKIKRAQESSEGSSGLRKLLTSIVLSISDGKQREAANLPTASPSPTAPIVQPPTGSRASNRQEDACGGHGCLLSHRKNRPSSVTVLALGKLILAPPPKRPFCFFPRFPILIPALRHEVFPAGQPASRPRHLTRTFSRLTMPKIVIQSEQ
ncbi:hypothetical protein RvY_08315 [Ramazzottius varieornatus]|uniref:Uncharacterized protein n=1 Tax=Ramazzottius varieornatus TaxID=947166 RepID=A0A1D1V5I3_RAMVA|nr:hypothetical protein RvY_08315 [Ramazzottius varieornatus]